jgi:predicted DNA-binding transcriptional regulator YafY
MTKTQRWFKLINEIHVRSGQTGKQLAEKFGRTERTIQRDIDELAEIGIVIVNHNGYRFLSKPYLPPLALSREEVLAIMLARQLAQRQLDPQARDALSQAVDKMRRGMGGTEQRTAEGVEKHIAVLPSGATDADVTQTLLSELSHAVNEQLTVEFSYQGREDKPVEQRRVEPLGLSFQESRWYLHAYDQARQGERTFRLGRMTDLTVTSQRFEPQGDFSAEKAAFHQWDLGEGDPVQLTMNVTPGLARWFAENKPHPTVNVDGTTVTLSVNDPNAFLRWFASLDGAELLEPAWCRDRLAERLARVRALYAKDQTVATGPEHDIPVRL